MRKLLWFFLILVAAGGAVALWFQNALNTGVEHEKSEEYIVIERGSSQNAIIETLTAANVLRAGFVTKLYLRLVERDLELQAGDYRFPSPVSPLEVIDILRRGKKRTENLTIPEGWTRFEIAERIAKRFPSDPPLGKEEVLEMMNRVDLIQGFDAKATNLEGYLYPTTYQVEVGTAAGEVIARMVSQFNSVWKPAWEEGAEKMGRSKREIMVVASLIENESKRDEERPLVASVIYNRLAQGIPLGIDATNVYIAKMRGRWDGILHKSDLEIDHPYNTRKIRGLPPGPICSPSVSAIEAALNPAQTDYLFYVLNVDKNDGSHHFYATNEGFLRGKARYQKWLRAQ